MITVEGSSLASNIKENKAKKRVIYCPNADSFDFVIFDSDSKSHGLQVSVQTRINKCRSNFFKNKDCANVFFQNKQALDELLHKPTMYFLIYFPFFWCIVLFLCGVLSIYGSLQAWSVQSNFLTFTKYSVLSGKLIIAFWKRKVVEHYGSKGMFLTYSLWYCIIKRKWNSEKQHGYTWFYCLLKCYKSILQLCGLSEHIDFAFITNQKWIWLLGD